MIIGKKFPGIVGVRIVTIWIGYLANIIRIDTFKRSRCQILKAYIVHVMSVGDIKNIYDNRRYLKEEDEDFDQYQKDHEDG